MVRKGGARLRDGAMSAEQSRFVGCLAGHGSVKPARSWISIQSPSSWLPATRLGLRAGNCWRPVDFAKKQGRSIWESRRRCGRSSRGKDKRVPEPCIFVVFGASGDLTKRKLLPALFHLRQAGLLSEEFAVVGVARRDLSETFVPDMKNGIFKGGGVAETDPRLDSFLDRVKYFQTDFY